MEDSGLAGRMQGVLLTERRSLLGAIDLLEGGEELTLTLNLNYQMDVSYVIRRLSREKFVLKIKLYKLFTYR